MNRKRSLAEWQRILSDFQKSGLSRTKWCYKKGIPLSTFLYQEKKLNTPVEFEVKPGREKPDSKHEIIPLTIMEDRAMPSSELGQDDPAGYPVMVRFREVTVHVAANTPDSILSSVFIALKTLC